MSAKSILIVDDDPSSLDIVRTYLESAGYNVLTAPDGRKGLVLLEENHPDLLLLDVMMPGMDGWEVARLVRNHPALASTRIVLLTARGDFTDQQKGLHAGADDYLVKPVSLAELGRAVARNLEVKEGGQ